MTIELNREAIARIAALPGVAEAAEAGSALISLWPLTEAMQMDNDAKYAENLQVRVTHAFARILTGQDVTMPDAEFVYEGADEIPGRPQSIVDTLLAANDAYDTMAGYSESGDVQLIFDAAEALGVDWDSHVEAAVRETVVSVEAQVEADAEAGGRLAASGEPADVGRPFRHRARRMRCAAERGERACRDGWLGLVRLLLMPLMLLTTARATAIVTLPILLYVNELREQCSIPRICLTDQQILDLIDTRANAGDTLTATAEYTARWPVPNGPSTATMCSGTRTKPRRRPRKKTKSATRRPWPPSLRTLKMTLAKKPWSCENQGSLARLIVLLPCSRFLRAKEIVYVVKNIAYATEEETLMGNGVNLRTLTNDGGSAVISDYGAHLLRWAPAGQPDVIWTPRTWHFEAGQPVGGGVPVCFPWFGPGFVHGGQTAKRPIHGFARLRQWALDEGAFTSARVRYVLDSERLTTGEVPWIEDEPNVRFHAAYEVCASDTLTMTLTVTNTGGEPMSYEAALHSYLHVGDVLGARLVGLRVQHIWMPRKPDSRQNYKNSHR